MVSRVARIALWWRDAGLRLRLLLFIAGVTAIGGLVYTQRPDSGVLNGNNLIVFGLVNVNIVVLLVLAFLIGRNVVKLIFDRRRNILGSRLRMRLVLAFIGLALVPTVALFVFSSGLLTKAMEGWFSSQVENAFTQSVKIAHKHYDLLERNVDDLGARLNLEISQRPLLYNDARVLQQELDTFRKKHRLFSIVIRNRQGGVLAESRSVVSEVEPFREPEPDQRSIERALRGDRVVLSGQTGAAGFIRGFQAVSCMGQSAVLIMSYRLDDDLMEALEVVNQSNREYKQLELYKGPLKSGYLLTLALMTALMLFSAIWIGFYMAREIAVPIQRLAEGTRAVARGNYDFHIREQGDDEISFLVRSFNSMIGELKQSRAEVERRTQDTEAIISNLAVGVVGIDPQNRVSLINSAAARLFDLGNPLARIGEDLRNVAGETLAHELETLLDELEGGAEAVDRELSFSVNGSERKVICTVGRILDARKALLGAVLLFEDVTDLLQAEQLAAWREVARRIAHEIKNPLTPIQLSAQRLQRLIESGSAGEAAVESTQTIIESVNSIKRLINEFSNFARMPTAQLEDSNLNHLIADTIAPFVESHPEIVFQFIADRRVPEIPLDREQIRRVVINLIDNAISAITEGPAGPADAQAQITLRSGLDRKAKVASFEVLDNGPGISARVKSRIFEPYFTTRQKGTGLGLSIVNSIISDHQGQIRVYDNYPKGTRFVIQLPITQKGTNQRRGTEI